MKRFKQIMLAVSQPLFWEDFYYCVVCSCVSCHNIKYNANGGWNPYFASARLPLVKLVRPLVCAWSWTSITICTCLARVLGQENVLVNWLVMVLFLPRVQYWLRIFLKFYMFKNFNNNIIIMTAHECWSSCVLQFVYY